MISRSALASLLVVAFAVAVPLDASAEWFIDLFAGHTWTERSDLGLTRIDRSGTAVRQELLDVEFDGSAVAGVRAGYWFGFAPLLGLGVDAFFFRPDIPTQLVRAKGSAVPVVLAGEDVPAAVVGLDLFLRWPLLASTDFPHGRLQPYVTAGPSALITDPEDFGTSLGFKLGAGAAWHVTRRIALFAEYRFTRFTPEVDTGNVRYETDLNSHHVVGGISFRF
jgi:opacity protein-like surface antigen